MTRKIWITLLVLSMAPLASAQLGYVPRPVAGFTYSGSSWIAAASTSSSNPIGYVPDPVALYCFNSGTGKWVPADSSCFGGSGSGTVSDGAGTTTPNLPAVSTGTAHTVGYSANPLTPSLTSPLGATHTLWVTGKLALAQTGGSGYSGTGTCTLTGGTLVSGSADTCTATQSGGAITFAIVGTGVYSVMPAISFGGVSAGTGAWANVYNDPANTTIYVRDESTGAIVSGSDLNPLMTTIFNKSIGINTHFYFKNGWYPINSLTQSANSGCTNYYAGVFVPAMPLGSWTQNIFTGESGTTNINEAAVTQNLNAVQTNGVIWYVTPTAVSSVSASNFIAVEWQDINPGGSGCVPTDYTQLTNEVFFENITARLPSQRAHSGGFINWNAESTRYKASIADFAVSYTAIATGSAPPADTFGMTAGYSFAGEVQEFQQTSVIGWNIGYDWGELVESHDSEAGYNNYPIQFGRAGSNFYHNTLVEKFLDQENLHGPLFGAAMQAGSRADLIGYDIEFGTANWYARTTPNAVETNAGATYGLITYSQVQQGGARLAGNFFTTNGSNFTIFPSGTASPSGPGISGTATPAGQLASYNFATVENPLSLGGSFSAAGSGGGGARVPSAGIAEPISTSVGAYAYYVGYGTWPLNQWSQFTIKTIAATSIEVLNVRMASGANTAYQMNISPTVLNLYAYVSGTPHALGTTQTISTTTGDVWRLTVTGIAAPIVSVYQNGALVYSQVDGTYGGSITSGTPGFGLYDTSAITNAQISAWAAGSL